MLWMSVRLRFVLKQGLQEWLDASDFSFYAAADRGCTASCTSRGYHSARDSMLDKTHKHQHVSGCGLS